MTNIIRFPETENKNLRTRYRFINRNTKIINEDGESTSYPCIVLYEMETNIPVEYTGLERYIEALNTSETKAGATMSKKAFEVCKFLNYLLHMTKLNGIHECDIDVLRGFLKGCKVKENGENYNHDTWIRMRDIVFAFLRNYYLVNKSNLPFQYDGDALQALIVVKYKTQLKKVVLIQNAGLNVKGPITTHKKNRILVYGYLDLLLYEAKKYDPELALGIALQAYAGLREGEVVNLTYGKINVKRGAFSSVSSIELDVTENALHFRNWGKKTNPGMIKKCRKQKVYDDFFETIICMLDTHTEMMEGKGLDIGPVAPVFVNYQCRPMTVQTYTNRVKKLFYNHFMTRLKITCERQNTWAENAAFIEIYENEYPGAHMFRHWFTMYLITKARLSSGEVMRWRGDSSQESMNTYIHENSNLIEIYRESSYAFQAQILNDIE